MNKIKIFLMKKYIDFNVLWGIQDELGFDFKQKNVKIIIYKMLYFVIKLSIQKIRLI